MSYFKKSLTVWILFISMFSTAVFGANPVVTSTPIISVNQDSAYIYTPIGSDAQGDALNWSVKSGTTLPFWLTISGVVSTFAGSGNNTFADGSGTAASFNYPFGVAMDSKGNMYVADSMNHRIRKITSDGVVSTFAGSGTAGSTNGTGIAASFNRPYGVAVDSSDNVYVADQFNHKIRKITSTGVVSTFAGGATLGSTNGTGTAAKFRYPQGITVDSSGNVYVADTTNHSIRKITSTGVVTTLAGSGTSGSTDATGIAAKFYNPSGVAVDSNGNVYVADKDNHKIRKITSVGVVSTLAGSTSGFADGTGTAAKFKQPYGITLDSSGNLYIGDAGNHKIRKITSEGVVTTLAGSRYSGSNDGIGINAGFNFPTGIAIDNSGNFYVADASNHKIRKITNEPNLIGTPRNQDVGEHNVSLVLSDGVNSVDHNFTITVNNVNDAPTSLDINTTINEDTNKTFTLNDFIFTDVDVGSNFSSIVITSLPTQGTLKLDGSQVSVNTVITVADIVKLVFTPEANANGTAYTTFKFKVNDGDLNSSEYRATIDVTPVNDVATITSTPITSVNQDSAYSYMLKGSDLDGDDLNWSVKSGIELPSWLSIKQVPTLTTVLNTGLSSPSQVYTYDNKIYILDTGSNSVKEYDDSQLSTYMNYNSFNSPLGLAIDEYTLYVADTGNNTIKKNSEGEFETLINSGVSAPSGLAIDSSGYLYIADTVNNAIKIHVGNGQLFTIKDGFSSPSAIVLDSNDDIYVADIGSNSIKLLSYESETDTFITTTVVSSGLNAPSGLAIDSKGNLYIADTGNNAIKMFDGTNLITIIDSGLSAPTGISFDENDHLYIADKGNNAIKKLDFSSVALIGTPTNADVGVHDVSLVLSDGTNEVEHQFTITVNNVNDLPISSNKTITIDEDTSKTFASSDFAFTDIDANSALSSVKIISLPSKGTLKLNGTAVSADAVITSANIANLVYAPTANANGTAYDSFTYKVNDGTLDSSDAYTMTFDVTAVNDAPTISGTPSTSVNEDSVYSFTPTVNDVDLNDTKTFSITNKPTWATLDSISGKLSGTPVNSDVGTTNNIVISVKDTANTSASLTAFNLTVVNVNDAPTITTVFKDIVVKEDSKELIIELKDIITEDVDNDLTTTPASYKVSSSDNKIANAYIENGKIIVKPLANAHGEVTISVTTTVDGVSSVKTFKYTIQSVNDAPTMSTISDITHEQSPEIISNTIEFDVTDDGLFDILNPTSSNENLVLNSNIKLALSGTKASLTYSISANNVGNTTITVIVKDKEGEEVKNSFKINVKAQNDSLCVENTKTALIFDTIKNENTSQDAITSDLDLVSTIESICDSSITWSSSDTLVLNPNTGVITKADENKTISIKANIVKGVFSTNKSFLITVPSNIVTDSDVLKMITFDTIKNKNKNNSKSKITSNLTLPSELLGKTITWTSSYDVLLSPYSGFISRASEDKKVTLKATIGTESKEFELTILKEEVDSEAKVTKDLELLTISSILGKNIDANNIIYDLAELPTLGVNGSTISWTSSNKDIITTNGDVFRDENVNKYAKLIATITQNGVTQTKEFSFNVLQNKIEDTNTNEFVNATQSSTGVIVTTKKDGKEERTESSFASDIKAIVENIISEDSVKTILEFVDKVINVYLNTNGTAQSTMQTSDGISSSIKADSANSATNVDTNGNVESTSLTTSGTVVLKLNNDGSVSHVVRNTTLDKTSTASTTIPGSSIESDNQGNVQTSSEIKKSGFIYRAVANTKKDGKTSTKFVRIDLSTGEQSNLDNTLSENTPYPSGNEVTISQSNDGEIYIKTESPLDGPLAIE